MASSGNNSTSVLTYDGYTVWIWCQAALSVMTIITFYICVCLSRFLWTSMTIQRQNKENTDNKFVGHRTSGNPRMSAKRKRLRMFMRIACLFGALSALIKFLTDQVKFFYAWNARSDEICETIYDVTDVLMFGFSYSGVYGFLWIKQWLFYCDPVAVKFLYSRKLVIFNQLYMAIISALSLGTMIVNWIPVRYKASNSTAPLGDLQALSTDRSFLGCVAVYDMANPSDRWPLVIYVALNTTFQFTLMVLFVYPLAWNRLQIWKATKSKDNESYKRNMHGSFYKNSPKLPSILKHIQEDSASVDTSSYCEHEISLGRKHTSKKNSRQTLSENALKSIRRTIVSTSICIITDTTLVTVFAVISKGTPLVLTAIAADFDILVNIICIIATYNSWKRILFPFFVRKRKNERNFSFSARSSSQDFA